MNRPSVRTFVSVSFLLLAARPGAGQSRPVWAVLPLTGEVILYAPGVPPGAPIVVHRVGGTPLQVRADLSGRAVAIDMWLPVVHLLDAAGFVTLAETGPLRDAIPDGDGGALLLLNTGPGSEVVAVDGTGKRQVRLVVPMAASILRSLGDGTVLMTGRGSGPAFDLRRYRLADGALLATRRLPAMPRDLPFDDDGHVLFRGLTPAEGLVIADRDLTAVAVLAGPDLIFDCAPYPGGRIAVIAGFPSVLRTLGDWPYCQQLPVLGSMSLQSWPDRSLCGTEPWTGFSVNYGAGGVLNWVGVLSSGFGCDDGAGLDHARSCGRDGDQDQDGCGTGLELACGTDPGDPASAPFRLSPGPPRLVLEAPWHPGATYVLQASFSAGAGARIPFPATDPLAALSWIPGAVFDHPVGILNALGFQAAIVVPEAPPGTSAVVAAALLETATLRVIANLPARPFLP